jgi:hypothetical protein
VLMSFSGIFSPADSTSIKATWNVRHNQITVHEINQADTLYWIERLLTLVNYLFRNNTRRDCHNDNIYRIYIF